MGIRKLSETTGVQEELTQKQPKLVGATHAPPTSQVWWTVLVGIGVAVMILHNLTHF